MSRLMYRLAPFGAFASLGVWTALDGVVGLSTVLLSAGAAFTGKRVVNLLDRKGNERKELSRSVRENVAELRRVARMDRVAAPQMKRLVALQEGVLESFALVPEEYGLLLSEDLRTVVDEVEMAAGLARRRAALRRHLGSVDRRAVLGRISELRGEIEALEEGSALRASFEAALEGRRGELAAMDAIPAALGTINAQIEGIEGLLGNLRGELLALDPGLSPYALESGLVAIKERVSYFRRGLEEATRSLEESLPEEAPAR
ncbi:MAG: hypothetical protein CYG60_06660 [Actinobacteria bacterium]|nr:MAG: hypothetical protein CYG60_06660 [Actinomycetota bacterium]